MLYLKKSKLPKAGKGLFTDEKLTRGDIICEYEGEIVPWSICLDRAEQGYEGYVFFISKNHCIDAYFTPEAMGRYANDARGVSRVDGLRNNAQYEIKVRDGKKRAFIVATRTIHPSEEIFVDYGQDYWKNLEKLKPQYEKMMQEQKEKRRLRKLEKETAQKKATRKSSTISKGKKK
jgi:uncharacterized protein